jgi:transcriptional regulator TACO1/YebC-like protein
MGRIFETRKHTMFARWDRMAKQFARIGKEITIAVRAGGPDPVNNPLLRRVVQNAGAFPPTPKLAVAAQRPGLCGARSYAGGRAAGCAGSAPKWAQAGGAPVGHDLDGQDLDTLPPKVSWCGLAGHTG